MAVVGNRPAKPSASRNNSPPASTRPSRIHHRPAASVRRPHRNAQRAISGQAPAGRSARTDPAGKHLFSPVRTGVPAMSRAKRRKNPHLPADLPASTGHRAAVLPAVPPAEAAALRRKPLAAVGSAEVPVAVALPAAPPAGAAVLRRKLLAAVASAAVPAAADFPRTPPEGAASAAPVHSAETTPNQRPVGVVRLAVNRVVQRSALDLAEVFPGRVAKPAARRRDPLPPAHPEVEALAAVSAAVVLAAQGRNKIRPVAAARLEAVPVVLLGVPASAVHPPKSRRKQKSPNPAQQEQGSPLSPGSLGLVRPVLSPAWQEWGHEVPSGPPFLYPGTAGIARRLLPYPHLERRGPVRYSRNRARPPGRASPQ